APWHATLGDIWHFAEKCLIRTAVALHKTRAASAAEIARGIVATRKSHEAGKPADLLERIAGIQGYADEHLGQAILNLGNKVATTLDLYQHVIPFAGNLIAPSHFYESFDHIHRVARVLLSPVIFAEDMDAIGTASANPMATGILAEEIRDSVFDRFGIRPFVTTIRLDYESWVSITRKHFEF
ncbi:MAG: hypothetical protein WCS43_13830, partial [Verrucomicrobiota bacterium]